VDAGTMNLTPVEVCVDENAVSIHNGNETLEPDDILVFVLHDGASTSLGPNIFGTSSTPDFGFVAPMAFETTYYISAVAGNNAGGTVDLSDNCLSVSQGTPVVFHDLPNAQISGGGNICSTDCIDIPVNFTGEGPFTLTYRVYENTDTVTNTITNTLFNPWIFTLCPTDYGTQSGPIVFELLSVSDNNDCDRILDNLLTFDIQPAVNITNNVSICEGESYVVGSSVYTMTGNYLDTLMSNGGCDSIINTILLVDQVISQTINEVLCPGETITIHGVDYGVGNYNVTWPGINGQCDTLVAINISGGQQVNLTFDEVVCPGQTVTIHGMDYGPGSYNETWPGNNGQCDTLVSITVVEGTAINLTYNETVCPNGVVTIHGMDYGAGSYNETWPGTNGQCDTLVSITVIEGTAVNLTYNETVCPGGVVSIHGMDYAAGSYNETWPGTNGQCDTLVSITVIEGTAINLTYNETVCPGGVVTIHGTDYGAGSYIETWSGTNGQCDTLVSITVVEGTEINLTYNETVCPGGTVSIHGMVYGAGSYNETWPGTNGQCDTLVNITVIEGTEINLTYNETVCPGGVVTIHGTDYGAGTYIETWSGTNGQCDTLVSITVVEGTAINLVYNETVCPGGTVAIHGTDYGAGNYNETWPGTNGQCDTLVSITVVEGTAINLIYNETVCPGGTVAIHGMDYGAGSYNETWPGTNGQCDTMASITVVEGTSINLVYNETVCPGGVVTIHGMDYGTGSYNETWTGTNGQCDTLVSISVVESLFTNLVFNDTICPGETVTIHGIEYTEGNYNETWPGTNSQCDTFATITIVLNPQVSVSIDTAFCEGQSVTIHGQSYDISGTYTQTWPGTNSQCDTLVSIAITVIPVINIVIDSTVCSGGSVTIQGNVYNSSGDYTIVLPEPTGCDTTINLHLNVLDPITLSQSFQICEGESISVGNSIYTASGTYIDVLTAANGCDSTITTTLVVSGLFAISIDSTICEGSSVTVGNTAYNTTGTYISNLLSAAGCDSIITLVLTVNPVTEIFIDSTICEGFTVSLGNNSFNTTGNFEVVLVSQQGCDSIIHLDLLVLPVALTNLEVAICEGEAYQVGNSVYTTTGIYTEVLTAANGCDSTIVLNLNVIPVLTYTRTETICGGESITVGNNIYTLSGNYTDTLTNYLGCDSISILNLTVIDRPVPVAVSDSLILSLNQPAAIDVLLNDPGYSAEVDWIISLVTPPDQTGWTFEDGIFEYIPTVNWSGVVTAVYSICDPLCPDNCTEAQIYIEYDEFKRGYIIITPNGDGLNDVFVVEDITEYPNSELIIFNRWGSLVFEAVPYANNWYGQNMQGGELPEGTYYYVLKLNTIDGKIRRGSVTIKR
jgi:gliding motility-associated-like protein